MSEPTNSISLYNDLEAWAETNGQEVDQVIGNAINYFYDVVLSDRRLAKFFIGANLGALREHQLT